MLLQNVLTLTNHLEALQDQYLANLEAGKCHHSGSDRELNAYENILKTVAETPRGGPLVSTGPRANKLLNETPKPTALNLYILWDERARPSEADQRF